MDPLRLSPWRGVNTVEDENSEVFAPSEQALPFLREAVNVDITRQGQIRKRKGLTQVLALTNGHSGATFGQHIYLVDNGTLLRVDVAGDAESTALATGLTDSPMSYGLFGGSLYFCNTSERGRITSNGVEPWGLASPPPATLAATTGNLAAGRYMVALTAELADGTESGARPASAIVVAEGQGITVSNIVLDLNAAAVNVYLTEANGSLLYWTARFAVPVTTINVRNPASTRDVIRTMNMFEPPQGSYLVEQFKGKLLVAAGTGVYWSQPLGPHLFKWGTDVQFFAEAPKFIAVVADGVYVGEGDRTWWIQGDDPERSNRIFVDVAPPVKCTPIRVLGSKIPALQTPAPCALWLTRDGIVAGQPGGIVQHLTEDRVAMSNAVEGDLVLREFEGISQVLASLRQVTTPNTFGFSDRAIGEVIRANT